MSRNLGRRLHFPIWSDARLLLLLLLGVPLILVIRVMVHLHSPTFGHAARDAEAMLLQPQRDLQHTDERRLKGNPRREENDLGTNQISDRAPTTNDRETGGDVHHGGQKQEHEPLNIVLFYADDWSFRTLGAMERALNNTKYKVPPFVKTPNIDKMAENGLLFTHNCVTTSICMVSRASLYTGQYASKHRTFLPEDKNMYAEGVWNDTLFPLLKQHGYHNGMVGKWHHPRPPNASETFGVFKNYFGWHYSNRNGKPIHVTEENEKDALEFLAKRPDNKPFALMVSFFAIHALDGDPEQYQPQNRSRHIYENETVPIPKTATEEHFNIMPPFLKNPANVGRGRWLNRYKTPELYQHMMKKTYRMITEVDAAVGRIVAKLEEQQVLQKTMLVFTTDNGNLYGEHGLAEKWYPYEESIRVPLVVVDPRMPRHVKNTIVDEFTLNIDLAPTLLSAANIPIPDTMQGRDIASMYLGSEKDVNHAIKTWRKAFYYEWFTGHKVVIPAALALVTKGLKYIIYPEYDYEELFLLENDPYEERNIFNSSLDSLNYAKIQFNELKALAESGVKV